MVKRLLAMVAVLAAVVRPDALAWGASGFSNRTLRGNYILEAAGLIAGRVGSSAEITVLGLVTFNGVNGAGAAITGNLTFTSSLEMTFPSSPSTFQQTCSAVIEDGSTYSVNADGIATVTVKLSTPGTPGSPTSSGTLDFTSRIINPGVARIVLSNSTSDFMDLVICAESGANANPIQSLVLIGDVTRQQK